MKLSLEFHPVAKPSFKRNSLKRTQRSEATPEVAAQVKARSNGVCEKCDRARATEKAHIERRWQSKEKPDAESFVHLCNSCHRWADSSKEGRQWLLDFQMKLYQKMEGIS